MIDSERALRDKMITSLERARNSIRPLNEMAYRFNQPVFLNELRAVDNEITYLIDKIRSSPSGFSKQVREAMKFDALYADSCELISDHIDDLYGKVIQSKMDFMTFLPELFTLRKMVVDMQNTYGGRLTVMTRANLIARGIQNKLNRDDMFAAKEVLEDLRVVAQESDEISMRLARLLQDRMSEIDGHIEELKKADLPPDKLRPITEKWSSLKKAASSLAQHKTLSLGLLDLGLLVAGLAIPGLPTAVPLVVKGAKALVTVISGMVRR